MICLGSRWSLIFAKRKAKRHVPKDNIVLCYPNGSFRIVTCDEDIARELYWHPEACKYHFTDTEYRLISLVGTITLMSGVICLGNSTVPLQVAFAAAYMILNVVYWVVAALPARWHWDLSCYKVTSEEYAGGEENDNFTQALWKAIAITGSIEWVEYGQVTPVNEGWKKWLDMAGDVVSDHKNRPGAVEGSTEVEEENEKTLPEWDPGRFLTICLNPPNDVKNV